MSRTQRALATPEVLRWARLSMNLPVEEVARRMQKRPSDIEAWERGETSPTYVQLETLAYSIYKRPIALFFFPDAPEEEDIVGAFRTLPEGEVNNLPSRIHYLLRQAKSYQICLSELYGTEKPPQGAGITRLRSDSGGSARILAETVRSHLGIRIEEQLAWKDENVAFKQWRKALSGSGVYVFKDSFKALTRGSQDSPLSSFCLYDPEYPIIYINNNNSITRQSYSLFHEYAHLLMNTSGIEYRGYPGSRSTDDSRRLEVFCNQFASSFLVPKEDFCLRMTDFEVNNSSVSKLGSRYKVSREVILRRLLDEGMISDDDYNSMRPEWSPDSQTQGKGGGGYYRTKLSYLDGHYTEAVFRRYYQGTISLEQAAGCLDIKVTNLPKFEQYFLEQGSWGS